MQIKVAKYISEFFVKNGINDCFMVTGGGAMHLDDAIGHQEGMHCTFNHHEQACSIAAEGYARMTGKIALICVTSGPGGTNAITGVMGGWLDSIPMFVISGQVKRETTTWACSDLGLRQLGDQEFNIIDSVKNMTKFAVMVTNPYEIAYHLEKALFLSLNGRKGPVWLDIPLDVQGAVIDTDKLIHFKSENEIFWQDKRVSPEVIDIIVRKIEEAKAPLVLAGTGINLANADEKLLAFLDKYKIPVVTAWNANDTVAFDNPYYVGMPGTVGIRSGNFAVQNCDLLISLGCRMNIRMIGYNHYDFAKNAFKVIVDIDSKELVKPTVRADLPVCADVSTFLDLMLERVYEPVERHEIWRKWCRGLLERYPAVKPEYYTGFRKTYRDTGKSCNVESCNENEKESLTKINPYVFIDELFKKLDNSDRIICGNGAACVITFQAAKIKQGQRMFTNSGCAAMGYGFPAALGVAVSDNSRRTVCIDGDGSVMMNIQELATVSHNRLNMKLFILNNNGYLSIRQTQRNLFKPPFVGIDSESGVGFPDFGKLADAFGISYFRLTTESEAGGVIDQVLNSDGPGVCEVVVDPDQNFEPKSSSKVLPDGKIVSPSLDDMFPFLDRDEFESIKF
ncbi:MAG: thiamine pyrophosphate-binding protein [Lachnospiraceae bacterium]|nr:thiamine pyrophosphate-binding protein [Lachnospiraceae bacterium]